MPVTEQDFVEEFPVFARSKNVSEALTRAAALTSESKFGAVYDMAVMLMAAHLLSTKPFTHTSTPFTPDPKERGGKGKRECPYLLARKELTKRRVLAIAVSDR